MRRRPIPFVLVASALGLAVSVVATPADASPGTPYQSVVLGLNLDGTPTLPLGRSVSVASNGNVDVGNGTAMRMTPQAVDVFTDTTPSTPSVTSYITDAAGTGYVAAGSTVSVIDGLGNVTHSIALNSTVLTVLTALAFDEAAPDYGSRVIYVLDAPDQVIQVIDPTVVDEPAGDAEINRWSLPTTTAASIALAPDHTLYVGDGASGKIWHYNDQGIYLGSFTPSGGDQGAVQKALGLVFDSTGTLFIADGPNTRIVETDASGNYLGMFGSADGTNGSDPATGQFDNPSGVAVDCLGNLYVLDDSTQVGAARVVGFTGVAAPTGRCAAGRPTATVATTQAKFLAVDRADNVFASSYGRVEKFDASLHPVTAWGAGHAATNSAGQFGATTGLAVAPSGDVFLSTYQFFGFDSEGRVTSAQLGTPKVVEFHSNGTFVRQFTSEPGSTPFVRPSRMAIRGDGHLFVGDAWLGNVQEFDASLHFVRALTLAPVPGAAGSTTPRPTAIAFDALGDTVVAVEQTAAIQSQNYGISAEATDLQVFHANGSAGNVVALPTADGSGLVVTGLALRPDGNFDYATATQIPGTQTQLFSGALLDVPNTGIDADIAPSLFNGAGMLSAVTDCATRIIAPSTTRNLVVVVRTSTTRCTWLPTATTGPMTKRTATSLTLTASSNPAAQVTKMRILYGPTARYGKATVWVTLPADNTVQTRALLIKGLLSAHYYHYRVQVQNASGTVYGADRVAKTL